MSRTKATMKTVLIVDDSPAIVESLKEAFEEAAYVVTTAVDGEEAFRKLAASPPDAILLDINMPKLNGADVCRLVKSHPVLQQAFLLLMSSRMTDQEVVTYRRMGADELLRKPFDPGTAVHIVARAVGASGF
jgi:twitching motility two-component system response regulator PilG/twitching motility two-component system response regulator PilH